MACLTIHPGLFALSEACKAVGYSVLKAQRLAAAHARAVDGWDEPVFGSAGQGGGTVQVGTIRRYSDRMLELLLKGDDPQRFNPLAHQSGQGAGQTGPIAIVINIQAPPAPSAPAAADKTTTIPSTT